MSKYYTVRRLLSYPKVALAKRIWKGFKERFLAGAREAQYQYKDLRGRVVNHFIDRSLIDLGELDLSQIDTDVARYLTDRFLAHQFDYLGSGWVDTGYFGRPNGLEGITYPSDLAFSKIDEDGEWIKHLLHESHTAKSIGIWKRLLNENPEYRPVDWQKDFKTGYRFSIKTWYKAAESPGIAKPGVDVKVHREFARLYHLPRLAIFAYLLPDRRVEIIREFKCLMMDYYALNPIGMGVSWSSTMDLGIRIINVLVAFDLFRQQDEEGILDKDFQEMFSNMVYEHGKHIAENLEYHDYQSGNHYYSNLPALALCAAYLQEDKETNGWLCFAIQEYIRESDAQFLNDGGNFESSTAYHRMMSEFFVFMTALVIGLKKRGRLDNIKDAYWNKQPALDAEKVDDLIRNSKEGVPTGILEKLTRSLQYLKDVTKEDGNIPQIGDNDSGKLLWLSPVGEMLSDRDISDKYEDRIAGDLSQHWDENLLNGSTVLSMFSGILNTNVFPTNHLLEKSFMISLCRNRGLPFDPNPYLSPQLVKEPEGFQYHEENTIKLDGSSLLEEIELCSFPETGVYVFKSPRLYLLVNSGANKLHRFNWSHTHNDKLSIELRVDGKDLVVDPGTYLYTAIPERRHEFRKTSAHNTMVVKGKEQARWFDSDFWIFSLVKESESAVFKLEKNTIGLTLKYPGVRQKRIVEIFDDRIEIRDFSNVPFHTNLNRFEIYSNGYGKRCK